jgi:hypothetical protein
LVANSERYLQAARSRSRLAKTYGEDLARQVLDLAFVKLAQEVVDGGPMAYSGATRLAEAVIAAVTGKETADVRAKEAKRDLRKSGPLARSPR